MNFKFTFIFLFFCTIHFAVLAQPGSFTDTTKNPINADSSENTIFEKVDIEASFPGGVEAWRTYLERNANGQVPSDNGTPDGVYTAIVQFIVDNEENISDVRALTNHGYGMEKEVIRFIAKGQKWAPAFQNGHIVKAYKKQSVTFTITPGISKNETGEELRLKQLPKISIIELQNANVYKILQQSEGTQIVSFTFTIDLPNGDIVETNNTGNQFSSATKMQIRNATPGRIFTIDNTRIMIDGKETKVASKVYRITD